MTQRAGKVQNRRIGGKVFIEIKFGDLRSHTMCLHMLSELIEAQGRLSVIHVVKGILKFHFSFVSPDLTTSHTSCRALEFINRITNKKLDILGQFQYVP